MRAIALSIAFALFCIAANAQCENGNCHRPDRRPVAAAVKSPIKIVTPPRRRIVRGR